MEQLYGDAVYEGNQQVSIIYVLSKFMLPKYMYINKY